MIFKLSNTINMNTYSNPIQISYKNKPTRLSDREVHVLNLLSIGYSSTKIGEQLFISSETVNSHRKNMRRKLKVSNTASLIRAGFEHGILQIYNRADF